MAELNHRVKNNLAMVSSLINLKSASLGEAVDLSDVRNQLEAIRTTHEKLSFGDRVLEIPLKHYVSDILRTVFRSMPSTSIDLSIDIEDLTLPAKTAMTIGLIINEAATNAVQHAFTPGTPDAFAVRFRREDSLYRLTISNTGRPFPDDVGFDQAGTLGLRLIAALSGRLGGSAKLEREPRSTIEVSFPAA